MSSLTTHVRVRRIIPARTASGSPTFMGENLVTGDDVEILPGPMLAQSLERDLERGRHPIARVPSWAIVRSIAGQGMAEYALLLALIAVIAIVALVFLGGSISSVLHNVGSSI